MSAFSTKQVQALRRKLDRRHVHTRDLDGRSIDYVEGWFAIAEANAIFGFDGWDREVTQFERAYERTRNDGVSCGYLARVRVRVRAGGTCVLREGTGWGSATAANPSDAHERAMKAAETDGTKRALATFGNRFGLGLYDKDQAGVTGKKTAPASAFTLYEPSGKILADNLSSESFCSGLRQMVETVHDPMELESLELANRKGVTRLQTEVPQLKSPKGVHYALILKQLIKDRLLTLKAASARNSSTPYATAPLKPSRIASGPRIDKSALPIGAERRLRDKAHLAFVASQPCLICGQQPTHAHHLTFAQKRGLSLKVSDEFTVPLCAIHHDALHRSGPERDWWRSQGVDPEPVAYALWNETRKTQVAGELVMAGLQQTEDAPPTSAVRVPAADSTSANEAA